MRKPSEAVINATNINRDLTSHFGLDRLENACLVRDWCKQNNHPMPMAPEQLAAGMGEAPYWNQGPAAYLDLINAVIAMEAA